ncbi:putative GTP-binding protein 6 [Culicoides brevitarsis]|uniref:putative GTP-binding protein 6 n=1 Tax=Culicoides brevitarsis TaxID=469753 RepID=UPI00307B1FE5
MISTVFRRSSLNLVKLGLRNCLRTTSFSINFERHKHFGATSLNRGQHRGRKKQEFQEIGKKSTNSEENEDQEETENIIETLNDLEYESLASNALHVSNRQIEQQVLVVQPYIKWGPRKSQTKPEHKLAEAEALVRSIPQWSVAESVKIGLESMDKREVFGPGQLKELKAIVRNSRNSDKKISAVFVSKGMLTRQQKTSLEGKFGVPVLDRYSVVIQILRLHAISAESKLQVAMAEIPYIWSQMRDSPDAFTKGQFIYTDAQKEMLKQRERRIKDELTRIRSQRNLLRRKRLNKNFPIIAVVGYTNAGKTSLIKTLTNESSMQPKDQLFATLDVTSHAGLLPCKLNVIFMDTVGFMSDIPTELIECFVATLEDAILADVILHVQDIAHENYEQQKKHVETTLHQLLRQISDNPEGIKLPPIINVGNKVDLFTGDLQQFEDMAIVSSKTQVGISDLLKTLENAVLMTTERRKMIIKVRCGGEEYAWLYKNTAVTEATADPKSAEHILMHVVISEPALQQFKHKFINGPK